MDPGVSFEDDVCCRIQCCQLGARDDTRMVKHTGQMDGCKGGDAGSSQMMVTGDNRGSDEESVCRAPRTHSENRVCKGPYGSITGATDVRTGYVW